MTKFKQHIMKKYLSSLEELKFAYPNLIYDDGSLINAEEVIEYSADNLINDHFDGLEVWDGDGSGNPEMDYLRKSESGKEYVELTFNGDYEEAYQNV